MSNFTLRCQIVHGAKLSAVPNCPLLACGAKLSAVPNCPLYTTVPNCPGAKLSTFTLRCQIVRQHGRCQIVHGAKLSAVPNCPRTFFPLMEDCVRQTQRKVSSWFPFRCLERIVPYTFDKGFSHCFTLSHVLVTSTTLFVWLLLLFVCCICYMHCVGWSYLPIVVIWS